MDSPWPVNQKGKRIEKTWQSALPSKTGAGLSGITARNQRFLSDSFVSTTLQQVRQHDSRLCQNFFGSHGDAPEMLAKATQNLCCIVSSMYKR
ncbi:hypothetical protein, partial [Pseudomonas viridiflava]|uniref:hypothetical protein n=2 Tax=Pseudomonas viridiflava TaxID=33069 RepID=UPI0019815C97